MFIVHSLELATKYINRNTVPELFQWSILLILYIAVYLLNKNMKYLEKQVSVLASRYCARNEQLKHIQSRLKYIEQVEENNSTSIEELQQRNEVKVSLLKKLEMRLDEVEPRLDEMDTEFGDVCERLKRIERTRQATRKSYENMESSSSEDEESD